MNWPPRPIRLAQGGLAPETSTEPECYKCGQLEPQLMSGIQASLYPAGICQKVDPSLCGVEEPATDEPPIVDEPPTVDEPPVQDVTPGVPLPPEISSAEWNQRHLAGEDLFFTVVFPGGDRNVGQVCHNPFGSGVARSVSVEEYQAQGGWPTCEEIVAAAGALPDEDEEPEPKPGNGGKVEHRTWGTIYGPDPSMTVTMALVPWAVCDAETGNVVDSGTFPTGGWTIEPKPGYVECPAPPPGEAPPEAAASYLACLRVSGKFDLLDPVTHAVVQTDVFETDLPANTEVLHLASEICMPERYENGAPVEEPPPTVEPPVDTVPEAGIPTTPAPTQPGTGPYPVVLMPWQQPAPAPTPTPAPAPAPEPTPTLEKPEEEGISTGTALLVAGGGIGAIALALLAGGVFGK